MAAVRLVAAEDEPEADAAYTCETECTVAVRDRPLHFSLVLQEEELAPLFSGASWAGTVVWEAAILMANHLVEAVDLSSAPTVVELGCGTGLPGFAALSQGARVWLTEQAELVELLGRNLRRNFSEEEQARCVCAELSWSTEAATDLGLQPDYLVAADCVYEPLYGESWRLLVDALAALAGPQTQVLVSLERRNDDGVDKFLELAEERLARGAPELVVSEGKLRLYRFASSSSCSPSASSSC